MSSFKVFAFTKWLAENGVDGPASDRMKMYLAEGIRSPDDLDCMLVEHIAGFATLNNGEIDAVKRLAAEATQRGGAKRAKLGNLDLKIRPDENNVLVASVETVQKGIDQCKTWQRFVCK